MLAAARLRVAIVHSVVFQTESGAQDCAHKLCGGGGARRGEICHFSLA